MCHRHVTRSDNEMHITLVYLYVAFRMSMMGDVTYRLPVLPNNIECAAANSKVEVCWDPYSESCPVSQYNLEWEGDVLWSEDLTGTRCSLLFSHNTAFVISLHLASVS